MVGAYKTVKEAFPTWSVHIKLPISKQGMFMFIQVGTMHCKSYMYWLTND